MRVKLVFERNTRNSAVYSSKDFGSLIVTVYVPRGRDREEAYDVEVPDELVNGKSR